MINLNNIIENCERVLISISSSDISKQINFFFSAFNDKII